MRSVHLVFVFGLGATAFAYAGCSGSDGGASTSGSTGGSSSTSSTTTTTSSGSHTTSSSTTTSSGSTSSSTTSSGSTSSSSTSSSTSGGATTAAAVYTMSNAASGNEILGFKRGTDGSLTPMAAPFPTGGAGSGAGLGEQGAVAYDTAKNRLYAVNAGDNSFSILPVNADGSLGTAEKVAAASGLVGPKSITFRGDVVYVLYEGNATTPSSIAGYTVSATGATAIAGSTKPLSSATQSVDPAQLQFTPDGSAIVVTEKQSGAGGSVKGNGMLDLAKIDASGALQSLTFYPTASGPSGPQSVPFGFAFSGSTLVVSEAGAQGTGVYTISANGIAPVSSGTQFLPTDPAPCWVASWGGFAYVANARGPNVSGFGVSATTGALTPIGTATNAVVAMTGKTIPTDGGTTFQGPTDESISEDGKFLYVLDAAVPAIGIFAIGTDGTLTRVGSGDFTATAAELPMGSVGIAAR